MIQESLKVIFDDLCKRVKKAHVSELPVLVESIERITGLIKTKSAVNPVQDGEEPIVPEQQIFPFAPDVMNEWVNGLIEDAKKEG